MQIASSSLDAYTAQLEQMAALATRDAETLAVEQMRKLAYDLYSETNLLAATKAEIRSEMNQRWVSNWAAGSGGAVKRLILLASKWLEKKNGKGHKYGSALAWRAAVARAMERIFQARADSIRYIATGWFGAIRDLGGSVKRAKTQRGYARIRRGNGVIEIIMVNDTDGVETLQNKHDFVGRAIRRRVADMQVYINRKLGIP